MGVGASVRKLNAVDGVDLLYAGSQWIEQDGGLWDVRAGLAGDLGDGRRLETAVVHGRFSIDHDVTYLEWRWNDSLHQVEVIERVEENLDRTRTTWLHAVFTARVGEGWRAGTVFTVNRKSHPKIPNYDLANVPRDPGDSWAFNIGAGLGHRRGPLTSGVKVVYEPVWSETWAEAEDTVRTVGGTLLQPGDHTVENDFFLSNLHLRLGLGRETRRWGFQLGLRASSHETELEQWNVIDAVRREQDESWMKWTPSAGRGGALPGRRGALRRMDHHGHGTAIGGLRAARRSGGHGRVGHGLPDRPLGSAGPPGGRGRVAPARACACLCAELVHGEVPSS